MILFRTVGLTRSFPRAGFASGSTKTREDGEKYRKGVWAEQGTARSDPQEDIQRGAIDLASQGCAENLLGTQKRVLGVFPLHVLV